MHFWHVHALLGKIKYVMKGTNIINAFLAFSCTVRKNKVFRKDTDIVDAFLAFSCFVRKNKERHERHLYKKCSFGIFMRC